jgi:hypothetical protein
MELKEFIEEVLTQITEGTISAQEKLHKKDAIVNPPLANGSTGRRYKIGNTERAIEEVEFEVALTASSKEGNKKGIGVFFSGLSAGGNNEKEAANIAATKIKFKMQIILPHGKIA